MHATGVLLDGRGVAIFGPSGAGKSLLAMELINRFTSRGRPAVLVGDDRLDLDVADERLRMRAPAPIAGRIELRGRGIVRVPFATEAPLDLVVELVDALERMPETGAFRTTLLGVPIDRAPVPRRGVVDVAHQVLLIEAALDALAAPAGAEKTT